jgi:hypothetical protein
MNSEITGAALTKKELTAKAKAKENGNFLSFIAENDSPESRRHQ